jgi:hypothetical protein
MQFPMAYDKTAQTGEYDISRKKIMLKKIIAFFVVSVLILASVMVVRHYFYILDSYYYSAEFHVNFMNNNLKSANIELVTDYFKSLKTIPKIFPFLLFAYLIKNFWLFFSKPILVSVITSAAGLYQSAVLNYISLLSIGLISFGLGIFFLGDIVPLFFKKKGWQDVPAFKKYITYGITGALFSIPIMPIVIPAFLSALIRIGIKPAATIMLVSFVIRLFLLISFPNIFI